MASHPMDGPKAGGDHKGRVKGPSDNANGGAKYNV
jgi:hypothetical protein